MSVFKWIGDLFSPATKLVEALDISGNKKVELNNMFADIQAKYSTSILDLEKAKLEMHSRLVESESKSEHWIVYAWRPTVSVIIVVALLLSAYGIGNPRAELFDLASIILGGTIGGRSLEKIAHAGGLGALVKGKGK